MLLLKILISIPFCCGKLLHCSKIQQSVCSKDQKYTSDSIPEPYPTKIEIDLKFFDVTGVNEEQHTITLSMKAALVWQDNRLDVNRSEDSIQRCVYFPLFVEVKLI